MKKRSTNGNFIPSQGKILSLKAQRKSTTDEKPKKTKKSNDGRKGAATQLLPRNPNSSIEAPVSQNENESSSLNVEAQSVRQDLQFSNMVVSAAASCAVPSSSGQGPGKSQRLKRLLEETARKRQKLRELSRGVADGPKEGSGAVVGASERLNAVLWSDALKAASGERPVSGSRESEAKLKKAIKNKQKVGINKQHAACSGLTGVAHFRRRSGVRWRGRRGSKRSWKRRMHRRSVESRIWP